MTESLATSSFGKIEVLLTGLSAWSFGIEYMGEENFNYYFEFIRS